jgi:hypothetical protein
MTDVVVMVDFAVIVLIFVDTTSTKPAQVTRLGYAAGKKTGLPFTSLHVLRCLESRSSSSGASRARLGGAAGAGTTLSAPGNDDLMGWKPAVVVVIVGAIVAVVSMVIETVLVSVTVLWKMSDDSRVMLRGCGTYPVVVTSTGGGVMTFVGVTVRFF